MQGLFMQRQRKSLSPLQPIFKVTVEGIILFHFHPRKISFSDRPCFYHMNKSRHVESSDWLTWSSCLSLRSKGKTNENPSRIPIADRRVVPYNTKREGRPIQSNKCPLQMATEKSKHWTISTTLFQLMECRRHGREGDQRQSFSKLLFLNV